MTHFEMILFENVAYLVSDDKREKAFASLCDEIGASATSILAAPQEKVKQKQARKSRLR